MGGIIGGGIVGGVRGGGDLALALLCGAERRLLIKRTPSETDDEAGSGGRVGWGGDGEGGKERG